MGNIRKSTSCNHAACICVGVLGPEHIWKRPAADGGNATVAVEPDKIAVVNTNAPDGARVEFTHEEWRDFIEGAKRGDFDLADEEDPND